MFVILLLFGLAIAWYYTGGPSRPSATSGPFLESPIGGEKRGALTAPDGQPIKLSSGYKARIKVVLGARKSNPQKEYIEIYASPNNKVPMNISNWSIEGTSGEKITIGKSAYLPYLGEVGFQQEILLSPGEKIIVTTGESPVGTSFRANKCIGYLSQMQDFYPSLSRGCPNPAREESITALTDSACVAYVTKNFKPCTTYFNLPAELSSSCRQYIDQKINYNGCVDSHKYDSDFYKPEWRVYLGRSEELWKNRNETVILSDENNKVIDWASY